jgi:Mce-associated membrane protein
VVRRLTSPPAGTATVAAGVAVLVAGVFAVWSLLWWAWAATDAEIGKASARDEVVRTAREHVAVLTTLDHHDVDAGIDRWLAVTTGPLHAELADTDAGTREAVRRAATVANAEVVEAGLSAFSPETGTATLLAAVEITRSRQGEPPTTTRQRFVVSLAETAAGWKVSGLERPGPGGGK